MEKDCCTVICGTLRTLQVYGIDKTRLVIQAQLCFLLRYHVIYICSEAMENIYILKYSYISYFSMHLFELISS